MCTNTLLRLWRVVWVHRSGYQAPTQVVEAKTKKEVIEFAKEQRLADFPESWSFRLEMTDKIQKNGKWYNP
jgi:hypothetical protein